MRFVGIVDREGQKLHYRSVHASTHVAGRWLQNFLGEGAESATITRTSQGLNITAVKGQECHHYFLGADNRFTVTRHGEAKPSSARELASNLAAVADTMRTTLMTGHHYSFTSQPS